MLSQSLSAVEIPRPQPMKVTSETIYSQACTSQMRQGGACRIFIFRYATSSEARSGLLQCMKTGKKQKAKPISPFEIYIFKIQDYFIISSEK